MYKEKLGQKLEHGMVSLYFKILISYLQITIVNFFFLQVVQLAFLLLPLHGIFS